MSTPPPGFNENNSLLPDVTAQIHVMKGGGNTDKNENTNKEEPVEFTEDEMNTINEYSGLDAFTGSFKREFLKQLDNNICTKDTGDSTILSSKCWAIQQYIQSVIHNAFKKANSVTRTSNTNKEKEEEKEEGEKKEEDVQNNNMSESLQGMYGKPNDNTAFENNDSNTDSVVTTNGFGQKGGSRKSRANKKSNGFFRRLPTRRKEKKNGTRKQKTRN